MFELLSSSESPEDDTETASALAGDWMETNGALVDSSRDVETSAQLSFGSVGADAMLASYLHGSPDPIFVVDEEGHFVFSNAACRRLFDREPGELMDDNLFDYDNADNSAMREVLDTREPLCGLEQEIVTDDGEVIPVERFLYPLFDADGYLVGGLEINRNVSERVSAQRRETQLEELRAYQASVAREFRRWLDRLSQGDYTIEPEVPEPDGDFEDIENVHAEFDAMATDLSTAVESAGRLLVDVQESARKLDNAGSQLSSAATETLTAAEQIDAAKSKVAAMADEQTDRAAEAEESVSTLSASIEEITANVQQISSRSSDAREHATEGVSEAETAVERMERAVEASERNVGQVQALEEQMANIEEMAALISDIADETNLLALNANIEAAHATTGSDGFGVVADEIKTLAEESKDTVEEISGTLEDLRTDIEATAETIAQSNDEIEAGAGAVEDAVDRIEEIDRAIEETDQGVAQIADATETQSENAQAVQQVIRSLAEGSEGIDEWMQEVSAGVEEQIEYLHQVQEVSTDVNDLSADLTESVAEFTLE